MAVYLFTYHAYRSWMPDRSPGYVVKGRGILPTDREQARIYESRAVHAPVVFSDIMCSAFIDATDAICRDNNWLLYEAVVVPSHVHILLGWREYEDWKTVSNRLKRGLGSALSKRLDKPGPWFSRGSSRKRITNQRHFDHLLNVYLPKHGDCRWTKRLQQANATADIHPQLSSDENSDDDDAK